MPKRGLLQCAALHCTAPHRTAPYGTVLSPFLALSFSPPHSQTAVPTPAVLLLNLHAALYCTTPYCTRSLLSQRPALDYRYTALYCPPGSLLSSQTAVPAPAVLLLSQRAAPAGGQQQSAQPAACAARPWETQHSTAHNDIRTQADTDTGSGSLNCRMCDID
jgi:hypothetical protein